MSKIYGLEKRIECYEIENCYVMKKKIYENVPSKEFDLVYANRTLNRECNSHISIQEKINSLMLVVKGVEIYLHYLIAGDEDDNEKYPINLYPRVGEVPKFFSNDDWEIILLKERFKVRPEKGQFENSELHYHKYGYVHARKCSRAKRLCNTEYKYHYNMSIGKK